LEDPLQKRDQDKDEEYWSGHQQDWYSWCNSRVRCQINWVCGLHKSNVQQF